MSAIHQKDSYKIGHIHQYPPGTTEIYSNLTARSGNRCNIPGSRGVYFIGLQHFILDYLIEDWNHTFFFKPAIKLSRSTNGAYQRFSATMLTLAMSKRCTGLATCQSRSRLFQKVPSYHTACRC